MSEETNFWGIAVQGYDVNGYPASVLLSGWRLNAPNSEPISFYPVFSSRESASDFVREHGKNLGLVRGRGEGSLLQDLLKDIRMIRRNEVSSDEYVLSDHSGLVKWSELFNAS